MTSVATSMGLELHLQNLPVTLTLKWHCIGFVGLTMFGNSLYNTECSKSGISSQALVGIFAWVLITLADLPSRGAKPVDLAKNELWITGPQWVGDAPDG